MHKINLKVFEPDENFYRNHVTFTSVAEIKKISEPLRKIGISYFTFDRTYKDGSHVRLTNAGKWIESYYRQKLYDVAIFEKDPKLFSDGHVLWSLLKREPVYSAAGEHDIDHGLTITQTHATYCDFYHFGSTCKNYISPDALISQISYLHAFIVHFTDRAHTLINQSENTRFILPIKSLTQIHLNSVKNENFLSRDIIKRPEIMRLYLGDEFDNMHLTRKEIEILVMLSRGKKTVEIAKLCDVSNKTVENHTKHIKDKFKCTTLCELGLKIYKLNIEHIFPFSVNMDIDKGKRNGIMARYD